MPITLSDPLVTQQVNHCRVVETTFNHDSGEGVITLAWSYQDPDTEALTHIKSETVNVSPAEYATAMTTVINGDTLGAATKAQIYALLIARDVIPADAGLS